MKSMSSIKRQGKEEMCVILTWVVITEVSPYANLKFYKMERARQVQGTDAAMTWR